MILDTEVTTSWNPTTRKYYEGLGYCYTKYNDKFIVKIGDLMESSALKVHVSCDGCGEPGFIGYNSYTRQYKHNGGLYYCHACANAKIQDSKRNERVKTQMQKYFDFCDKYGYTPLMDESEYKNARTKMPYLCPKHGEKTITIDTINGGGKCKQCSMEEFGREISRSTEEVIEIIDSKNSNKVINPEDYVNVNTPNLRIICGSCGQEFTTSLASIMASQGHCYSCGQKYSKGEDDVESFLIQNGISFEPQKRFEDCKDNKPLPFDFYLPENNICIEFDGQGHYKPVFGQESFERTVKHDKMKNEYCKKNGIKLIRIPYWKGSKINEILSKELNIA